MNIIIRYIEKYFFILVLLFSFLGLLFPQYFIFLKPHIPKLLGLIMFGMGITLKFHDFLEIWDKKHIVSIGVFIQYTIMPLLAFLISYILNLPKEIMIGMIIVGSCPGGTASNVITYIAKANVPLSISMTLASTLISPLITPLILYLFLSQKIELAIFPMMKSVFWIVAFPLFDGLVIRHIFKKRLDPYTHIFPSISILAICLIVACVVALNHTFLKTFPYLIFFAVFLHNTLGLTLGYSIGRALKFSKKDSRTLSIEIGMQNSGLGTSLAIKFFSLSSALINVVFSVWHNLSGIILANYFSRNSSE